jgi:hypothetical protein
MTKRHTRIQCYWGAGRDKCPLTATRILDGKDTREHFCAEHYERALFARLYARVELAAK